MITRRQCVHRVLGQDTERNPQKAGELAGLPGVTVMPLDLMDPEQIRETSRKALAEYDVDVLFNNAGYGMMGPFEKLPEEEIRKLYDQYQSMHMEDFKTYFYDRLFSNAEK